MNNASLALQKCYFIRRLKLIVITRKLVYPDIRASSSMLTWPKYSEINHYFFIATCNYITPLTKLCCLKYFWCNLGQNTLRIAMGLKYF